MKRRKICIKQRDTSDCGAASLASVAAYYDLEMPVSRIRQIACTNQRGTNVLGMVEAAEKLGFACKAVKAVHSDGTLNMDALSKIPKPAIAHVLTTGKYPHFVVIYGVKKTWLEIMDPGSGELEKVKEDDFIKIWTGKLILLVPNEDFVARNEKISIAKRFWFLFKPHKRTFLQALFGSLVYTLLGLVTAVCIQKIIDYVIPDGNRNLLHLICLVMIVATLLSVFIGYIRAILMMRSGVLINSRLILGYYKHLLKLPQSFFDNMRSGEIISRMGDAAQINTFINSSLLNIVINVFTVIVSFVLMFTYYWKLALMMLISIPVYFVIFLFYNKVNKVIQRKIMEEGAELESQLVESINAAGTIKQFGIEDFANVKTENRFVQLTRTGWKSGKYGLVTDVASNLFSSLFVTALLWIGTSYVLDGIITPGELMSFHTLTGYFMGPVISLVSVNRVFQNAKIAADRLFEIFDLEPEDDSQKIPFYKEQCGDISFKNVCFRYGTRTEVFNDFNITFKKGEVSAVIGESGSGKTTLVALLQNLYPLQSGNIRIGETDIRNISSHDLRKVIGIVPQQIDLFHGTIADNIILDDFEPDWQRVYCVCNDVGITDWMEKLPHGIQTEIGENGTQLSGGQRQRIAIARALYPDPEILVLDEATSSLDAEAEQYIKKVIQRLKSQGKTVLLIAHRLGTIMNADEIFVLKEGVLTEHGTHQELLLQNGQYARFWQVQTQI
ncbi:MAG: peptidase domain-containing ABC transporter [Bacteroidales bacterium]|nr:peptidase domain-containing ABC transporter [Bacteroidales bacterium]